MSNRYEFAFSWDSTYGHIVQLVDELGLQTGAVLDLGCGHGAVGEPLTERGFTYVGADVDTDGLAAVAARGFETHQLDLDDVDRLAEQLVKIADGRLVAAVLLIDVLEHLHPVAPFLLALRASLDDIGSPPLLISVPNVAHVDIAAKLVFGLWDTTDTGLLDDTHKSFFNASRLEHEMRRAGLIELRANDFVLPHSDQHFPRLHPALHPDGPVGQLLRGWREMADDHGYTSQFVRAFMPAQVGTERFEPALTPRFASVVMRSQGRRPDTLREALTCLAAQTDDDFDVLLMVHSEDLEPTQTVTSIVNEFHATFADRVSVISVRGGGRSRPLNEALDRLRNDYVVFLDDDDLVTANWIEEFKAGADGLGMVRSMTVERRVAAPLAGQRVPYQIESGLLDQWVVPFNLAQHFWQNHTPICSVAVPRAVIDLFRLRFDEQLSVIEDWHFLVRVAMVAPVRDTGEITSIYHRYLIGDTSTATYDSHVWDTTHRSVLQRLDQQPLVLPRGSASQLTDAWSHVDDASVRDRLEAIERSRWWRLTRPPARAVAWARQRRALKAAGSVRP